MNEHRPHSDDELLSAYFDGEVTPEERARVELLRNTSPDVAAKLASFAELSQALKSVPRESAPPEVRAAALRLAERTALLRASPKPVRPRYRYLREAVIFLTGVAATVVVGLGLQTSLNPLSQRHDVTVLRSTPPARTMDFTADAPVPASVSNPNGSVLDERFGVRTAMSDADVIMDRDGDGLRPLDERSKDATSNYFSAPATTSFRREAGSAGVANAPAASAANFGTAVGAKDSSDDSEGKASVAMGDRVQIAEVFPYLKANDDNDKIAIMDLYVNDPEQSANRLQWLLVQNGVQVEMPVEAIADKTAKRAEKPALGALASQKETAPELEQLAVYVDAPTEPVTQSLEEMAQRRELLGVRLRPPLALEIAGPNNEPTSNRSRQLDVEQLKVIFNDYQAEFNAYANADAWYDAGQPVDALEALSRETLPEAPGTQRRSRDYANRDGGRTMQRMTQVATPQPSSQPVPPIAGLQMESQTQLGINRLMKLPTSNTALRPTESFYVNQQATRALDPQAQTQLLADEARQRRRFDNANAFDNVRVLILLQESATTGKPTTTSEPLTPPATPAKK
jgi:hypothetical protein